MTDLGSEGSLSCFVWPVYVGLAQGQPEPTCCTEPYLHADYKRGDIIWTTMPNGEIVGRATIYVPAGDYTHLTYHQAPLIWPAGPQLVGYRQLEFALHFPAKASVTIDPINYGDWQHLPRGHHAAI